jgi:hypothetical protein
MKKIKKQDSELASIPHDAKALRLYLGCQQSLCAAPWRPVTLRGLKLPL